MNKFLTTKLITALSIPTLLFVLMLIINFILWGFVNSSGNRIRNTVSEKVIKLQTTEKNNINFVYKQRAITGMSKYFLSDNDVLKFMSLLEKDAANKGLVFQMGGVSIKNDKNLKRAEVGLTIEGNVEKITEFLSKVNQANKAIYMDNIRLQFTKDNIYRLFVTMVIYL